MNTIKIYIFNNFKRLTIIWLCCFASMLLLMIRLKLTHSFFYLFLVWNLFLAIIPFVISSVLKNTSNNNKLFFFLNFVLWLLFLPNAPYIITDLIHLRLSHLSIIWYDFIMITAFAISGLLLFYYSIFDMKTLANQILNNKIIQAFVPITCLLSAFGIYLGRILRYNSWELLSNPFQLTNDIIKIITQPQQHLYAWYFTIVLGGLLYIMYFLFKWLFINEKLKI